MIIFGTRGVTSTSGQGRFYCPRCEGERPYQTKRMRRFFTLYFIPLIPLDVLQEWIECAGCHQAYKPDVLHYDPKAKQTALRAAIVTAARRVLALAAGPSPAPEARAAALQAHQLLFGEEWPEHELAEDLRRAASPGATLEPVSRVSDQVNANGKEAILAQALNLARVAGAGAVAPDTAQALGAAASALGLSDAHWRGILTGTGPATPA
jgi:hypothetical protein